MENSGGLRGLEKLRRSLRFANSSFFVKGRGSGVKNDQLKVENDLNVSEVGCGESRSLSRVGLKQW